MQSAQCSVPSAELKLLDPKSALSMALTGAYLAVKKYERISVDGLKKRNRDWAKAELVKARAEYEARKQQAEREGFKV